MWEDGVRFVGFLLGGGFAVFLLQWFREWRSERRKQEITFLQEQLQHLYGPLHFFLCQNEQYMERSKKIHDSYKEHFEGIQWSEEAQERLDEQAKATLDIGNAYVEAMKENNSQIMELLKTKWHLADIDDIEMFVGFQVHFTRGEIEFDEQQGGSIPISIRLSLGDVHFYHADWVERVKRKWAEKRQKLGRVKRTGGQWAGTADKDRSQ